MSYTTDATQLARKLRHEGFEVFITGGSHWEIRWQGRRVTTFPSTPSDSRWKKNTLAQIKRWKRSQSQGIQSQALSLPLFAPQNPWR